MQTALQQTISTFAFTRAPGKTLVDNKGIGKPNTFDSDMKKWPSFSFKFKNFVSSVFENARVFMDWTEEHSSIITNIVVNNMSNTYPDITDFNKQLYTCPAQMTDGEACDIVKNTTSGWGLEAWRKLQNVSTRIPGNENIN